MITDDLRVIQPGELFVLRWNEWEDLHFTAVYRALDVINVFSEIDRDNRDAEDAVKGLAAKLEAAERVEKVQVITFAAYLAGYGNRLTVFDTEALDG